MLLNQCETWQVARYIDVPHCVPEVWCTHVEAINSIFIKFCWPLTLWRALASDSILFVVPFRTPQFQQEDANTRLRLLLSGHLLKFSSLFPDNYSCKQPETLSDNRVLPSFLTSNSLPPRWPSTNRNLPFWMPNSESVSRPRRQRHTSEGTPTVMAAWLLILR